ncbi:MULTISPECIES: Gfo/Idh/MocA family protein [Mesobacillus]|uniref:Gfo/Idh/MocA family oxidoreductase n=2 Tax=Mesobacillus TaxID=2675231 RepID=A0A0D6ZC40_9BACI|nr:MULTISPECIES: Gfo/Idh/MocA family oxidoreductase [Mesobacillus]KIY23112.1 hypothetical protein UB32_04470 [Mesobacillus subterraneus]MDQ0415300.1 putative dehydrogenase [Mesobacillus stamsii]
MNKIRFGIVGTGKTVGIASNHLEGINNCDDTVLAAIYDIDKEMARSFYSRNNLENVKICDSYEELLGMVDAVSICVPNDQHIEVAIKALDHNKHILVEKPIAVNAKSVDELLKAAESNADVISMVSFNYREFPIYEFIKELIDSGKLGAIYTCRQQLGGNRIADKSVEREWRMDKEQSGPGAVSDFGCHMLDLAYYLLSASEGKLKDFKLVSSTHINERNDPATKEKRTVTNDDSAMFIAKTESGALLSFSASRVGVCNHTIEVVGEGGMVCGDFSRPNEISVWLKNKEGAYQAEDKTVVELEGKGGHNGIIQNFADCVYGKATNERTIRHAKFIQQMIDDMLANH